jgi:hypothetical protein
MPPEDCTPCPVNVEPEWSVRSCTCARTLLTSASSTDDQGDPRSGIDETTTASSSSSDPSERFKPTNTANSHHDLVSSVEDHCSVVVDTGSTRDESLTCRLGTTTLSTPSRNIILASGQGDTGDSNIGKESLGRAD